MNSELDAISTSKLVICDVDEVAQYMEKGRNNLSVISQNIRSINANISSFTTLLHRTGLRWNVIILTECWLSVTHGIPSLDGYSYVASTSNHTQNEGVVVYYEKNMQVVIEEPPIKDANCLLLKTNMDTCILGIYRPHGYNNVQNFLTSIDIQLKTLSNYKNIILCGDINIDISPNTTDTRSTDYLNILASHGILPGFLKPTHGKTCLDHVMIKSKSDPTCFIIQSSVTDHESIALNLNSNMQVRNKPKPRSYIDYKKMDEDVMNIDFTPIFATFDVNIATLTLINLLCTLVKSNTKTKKCSKRKFIKKPWITAGLLRCMKNRDNLHKKLKQNPANETLKVTYKRYRNYCSNLIKKAKRDYDRSLFESAKGNPKKLWGAIKEVTNSSNKPDYSAQLISSINPIESINKVNHFFANIGKQLAERITATNDTPVTDDLTISPQSSFVLMPTSKTEVLNIIKGLRDNCAVGFDQISGGLIKRYAYVLCSPITHICNIAIDSGVFPSAFKKAIIKPIHKSGDRDCVNNYRPISILPAISKILERLVNKRLVSYLESNNILSSSQYGFRSGKSTSQAVYELVNSVISNLDDSKKCITVFLDLAKAFDTVSIPHLIQKLERVGVRGIPLKLFQSYLTDRKQCVKIEHDVSDELCVDYGVPQGSILGPTLFLVYINNLCNLQLNNGKIISFADDTALFFSGKTWDDVFTNAQIGFNRVQSWLKNNVLTLNTDKTKYIAFALKANLLPPNTFTITAHSCAQQRSCSCPLIERTDSIRYLGIIIDQVLTFKPHISVLVSRLRKVIYVFRTLRNIADRNTIRMVYYAICQSLIEYCITSWGGVAKTNLMDVEVAQRAILKVGAKLPYRYPTTDLYKDWSLLTTRQLFILHTVLKQHCELIYDPDRTNKKRRKAIVCSTPLLRTSTAKKFFQFLGPYLYNKANNKLDIYNKTKSTCKRLLTTWLNTLDYNSTEALLLPLDK